MRLPASGPRKAEKSPSSGGDHPLGCSMFSPARRGRNEATYEVDRRGVRVAEGI